MIRRALEHPTVQRLIQAAFVLGLVVITWLALSPHPPRSLNTGWDKSNHALAFAALALSAALGFRWRAPRLWSVLLAYGVLIEVLQTLVPGRSGEVPDLLADAVGIALGLLLAHWAHRQR